jgi:PAS domain S-box-containing protein
MHMDIPDKDTTPPGTELVLPDLLGILNTVHLICMRLDRNGNMTYINPYIEVLTGYAQKDLEGQQWVDKIISPEMRELVRSNYRDIQTNQETYRLYELPILTAAGLKKVIEWNTTVLYDANGEFDGTFSIGTDITRAHELERNLKDSLHSLHRLQKAVNESGEVIFMTDAEGVFTYINPQFTSIYGYLPEEVVGKRTPRILKSGRQPDSLYKEFWKLILSGHVAKYEFVNRDKKGQLHTLEISTNPVFSESGAVDGYLAIQHDVTSRRSTEYKLAENESRFRTVIEQTGQIVYEFTVKDNSILWMGAVETITGYTPEEVSAISYEQWMQHLHPDDSTTVMNMLEEVYKAGKNFRMQYRFRRKDGQYAYLEDHGICVKGEDGTVQRILGNLKDITVSKTAETQITQRNMELERLNKLMVGRELRMIELKQEIDSLKKKIPSQ